VVAAAAIKTTASARAGAGREEVICSFKNAGAAASASI
jgi:hypothetical protein